MNYEALSSFLKYHRKQAGLTQEELAIKAGVGLATVRDMEQGKQTLRMESVNKALMLFGFELAPERMGLNPYLIWKEFMNKAVVIKLKNRKEIRGFIVEEIRNDDYKISAWKIVNTRNILAWSKRKSASLEKKVQHREIDEVILEGEES